MVNKIAFGLKALPKILQINLGKPIPIFCQWEVTFKCNMNCSFCSINKYAKDWQPELNTQEALSIVQQLSDLGTLILNIGGGEPLLRKDIFEIISLAKKKGMVVFMNTNGFLLTQENAQKLKESGIDLIRVSVDGLPEFHDKIRQMPDAFSKAISGIKELQKVKVNVMINTVVTKQTKLDDLRGLAKITKELGIQLSLSEANISLPCIINPQENQLDKSQLDCIPSIDFFEECNSKLMAEFGKTISNPKLYLKIMKLGGLPVYGCKAMQATIGIKPNGKVSFPCSEFSAVALKGKLKEIYFSEDAKKQRTLQGKYWFCKNCASRCVVFPTMMLKVNGLIELASSWDSF